MSTRYGTNHFVSRAAAIRYYAAQGIDARSVDQKLKAGEIELGAPPPREGYRAIVEPSEGRYFMEEDPRKQQICDALAAWIRQRPGLEFGNYGNLTGYRAELRGISRDKRHAETLLAAVRSRAAITAANIVEAAKHAFSGRLEFHTDLNKPDLVRIEYTTGQYWPTEYRRAAAAVLASALWAHARDSMPAADSADNVEGMPAGDWLRKHFRKEFGSALQRRWFN